MERWFRFTEVDGKENRTRVGRVIGDSQTIEVFEGPSIFEPGTPSGRNVSTNQVQLLAPVVPSKFMALWNNFHEMAAKIGQPIPPEPLYFQKASNCFSDPGAAIRKPISYNGKVVYEGELGIVIGATCAGVSEAQAQAAIFGFTCVNDVTAIDIILRDPNFQQWSRAKSCDTFGPIGPCVAVGFDWHAGSVRTRVDGRERQNYPLSDMVFTPAQIVSALSRELTLYPGDIIACGTSLGVLPMRSNTTVEVTIDGIGTLTNTFEPATVVNS